MLASEEAIEVKKILVCMEAVDKRNEKGWFKDWITGEYFYFDDWTDMLWKIQESGNLDQKVAEQKCSIPETQLGKATHDIKTNMFFINMEYQNGYKWKGTVRYLRLGREILFQNAIEMIYCMREMIKKSDVKEVMGKMGKND